MHQDPAQIGAESMHTQKRNVTPSAATLAAWAKSAPEKLRRALHDPNAGLVALAVEAAGHAQGYREDLLEALNHEHPMVQEAAIYALERVGADPSIFKLIAEDRNRHRGVRDAALEHSHERI